MIFKHKNNFPHSFFKILPIDWQESIIPYWIEYKRYAKIYVLEEEEEHIIAGGIVFSICPPDMTDFKEKAEDWFEKGYLYIGYLWVNPDQRNQNLGSELLSHLKKLDPYQKYWLTIEEERLKSFYEKNGFLMTETLKSGNNTEWVYSYDPMQ